MTLLWHTSTVYVSLSSLQAARWKCLRKAASRRALSCHTFCACKCWEENQRISDRISESKLAIRANAYKLILLPVFVRRWLARQALGKQWAMLDRHAAAERRRCVGRHRRFLFVQQYVAGLLRPSHGREDPPVDGHVQFDQPLGGDGRLLATQRR